MDESSIRSKRNGKLLCPGRTQGKKKVFAEETCPKCKKRVRKEDILE